MIDNTVTKQKQQAILDEHKAAYLAKGGKITVVPSQTFGRGYNDSVISRKVRSMESFLSRRKEKYDLD